MPFFEENMREPKKNFIKQINKIHLILNLINLVELHLILILTGMWLKTKSSYHLHTLFKSF